jgi:hypothetical protein
MSILYFAGALLGIVLLAITINRLTGTKANYLDDLEFAPGEKELWRDTGADVALVPRIVRAVVLSYPRLRRHTVVWTDRRVVVAQRALFSRRSMVTHQLYFAAQAGPQVNAAAASAFGGFLGRGFETIVAASRSFGIVNGKACVRIQPAEESGARLNLDEVLIFTDRVADLEQSLP